MFKNYHRLQFGIDPDLYKIIKNMAKLEKKSIGSILRRILRKHIGEKKRKKKTK